MLLGKTLAKATFASHFKKGAFTAHHTNIFKLVTFNNNATIVRVTDLKITTKKKIKYVNINW